MNAIVIDTETSGFTEPDVIELAYSEPVKPKHYWDVSPVFHSLRFIPRKPIELGAMATHGITIDDLQGCPQWTGVWLPPKDTEYLIGHSIDYDWKAIGSPDIKRICTLALSRYTYPTIDSHSLGAMMFHLFPAIVAKDFTRQAHGAAADMIMTWSLLCFLLKSHFPEGFNWANVYELSEKARVPTVMTFGKHKGMLVKNVPADYKQWLRRQSDVDPYLLKALNAK